MYSGGVTDYKSLSAVKEVRDPAERSRAVTEYLSHLDRARDEAVKVRHSAIAEVLKHGAGPTEAARRCGVSVSLVKQVRQGMS